MWKLKLLVSVILISLCIVSWKYNFTYHNRTQFIDVCGTVYKKYEGSSKYGPEFIMVVIPDNGKVFDVKVTPSTYAIKEAGDRICFSDIERYKVDDSYQHHTYTISFIWFVFNVILSTGILVLLVAFILDSD